MIPAPLGVGVMWLDLWFGRSISFILIKRGKIILMPIKFIIKLAKKLKNTA